MWSVTSMKIQIKINHATNVCKQFIQAIYSSLTVGVKCVIMVFVLFPYVYYYNYNCIDDLDGI